MSQIKAKWIGKPDKWVKLEIGTIGTVRVVNDVCPSLGLGNYVFSWSVPGFDDIEEICCFASDFEEIK